MLQELNDAASRLGGRWVKLRAKGDKIKGVVLDFEIREKSFEGAPVVSRKTGKPRIEWLFTLQTDEREDDDDDGVRKYPANESEQRAIAAAIKDAGVPADAGATLEVKVTEEPETPTSQAAYTARWTPGPKISVPTDSGPKPGTPAEYDEEPFLVDAADWLPGVWGSYPERMLP